MRRGLPFSQATPRRRHFEGIVFMMYAFIAVFALILLVFVGIVVGLATGKLKPSHPGSPDHDFSGSSGPDF